MIDPPPPVTGTMRNPTKADVEALYGRLVRSYGPPVTGAAVFAQAVAAAMWEAVEVAEIAQRSLDARDAEGRPGLAVGFNQGQVYATHRIMRAVYDSLNPGKGCSPGLRLATRRSVCGLTQREVAAAAYLDRSHYARIELDVYRLRPDHARLFADVLGCTPEYLLTGEGGRP